MEYSENKKRSIVKAASWRLLGTMDTFIIIFFVTGTFKFAISVSAIEVITKFVLYFFHERLWNKIKYGRVPVAHDYQI